MFKNLAIFTLSAAAICAVGCKNASGDRVSTTNTTAAQLPLNAAMAPMPVSTTNDYASTVRREQITLKSRLDDAITAVDQQVSDLRRSGKPAPRELIDRRTTLAADSDVLAHSDERGWDELKATIDRDLEEP